MLKKVLYFIALLAMLSVMLPAASVVAQEPVIKIGLDVPMTGDIPKVGEQSKYASEIVSEEIEAAGGLMVGDQTYKVEFIVEDNESKAESATAAATKLITQDEVLVIVGPQASKQAVPTGEVANTNETPMVSPWSTNPRTTLDRPWVFRACFLDPFQGPVVANFVTEEFGFTKAAVLYDVASDYPKGLAEFFKAAWEELHGEGSVVAFETFTTGDADFSAQLTKIKGTDAEFLFTPQYYSEVPLIVQQAQELGITFPIMGSDSWGDPQTLQLCGEACEGYYFSTHYAAAGATGATKEFIDLFNEKYGYVPGDVAALTYDAIHIVLQAIQNTGGLTGDLAADRAAVRDQLAQIKNFEGITGRMTFTEEGDPIKCAVIVKIENGEFTFYKQACPPELAEAPAEAGGYTIVMVPKFTGADYFIATQQGGQTAADELGDVFEFTGTIEADVDGEIEIIDNLITRGVDALVVSANDPDAIVPVLKRAQEAGIPVVTYDADANGGRDFFVNQASFEAVGKELVDVVAEEAGEDAKYTIVSATATAANQNAWIEAMQAYMAEAYPDMEILDIRYGNDDTTESRRQAEDLINTYPDMDAIVAPTSVAFPAVADAVEEAGLAGEIVITGLATPNGMREFVKRGTVTTVVLWNPVDLGYLGVYAAHAMLAGELEAGATSLEAGHLGMKEISGDEILLGPAFRYTIDNIDDFNF